MRTGKLEGKKRSKLVQDVKEGLDKIQQAEADKLESDLPTRSTADQEREAILTVGKSTPNNNNSTSVHIFSLRESPQSVPLS